MSRCVIATVAVLLLAAWPSAPALAARDIARIGYLSPAVGRSPIDEVFEGALRDLGWVKGRNIRIEPRYSGAHPERLGPLAAELVDLGVDLLVAWSPAGALAAKRATSQVPVVFLAAGDPVGFGLVSDLAHPGGNVTGVSFEAALETYGKGLEILKEAVPSLENVAVLGSADPRTAAGRQAMAAAAQALKLTLQEVEVDRPERLEAAVRAAKARGAQALYVWPSGFSVSYGREIADVALANRLPSIHPFRENAERGGLLSYAPSLSAIARRGASYVDKILRGARPADLPVEQPTTFELVVNAKTAKALGLAIPPVLMLQADHVIE